MNRRQRQKIVPSTWLIVHRQLAEVSLYSIYMLDWKRRACFSWEEWNSVAELLQARIPVRSKIGGQRYSSQSCAKIAKKAIWLYVDEHQHEQIEQLSYRPFSKAKWSSLLQELTAF